MRRVETARSRTAAGARFLSRAGFLVGMALAGCLPPGSDPAFDSGSPGDPAEVGDKDDGGTPSTSDPQAGPTYYGEVLPLLQKNCFPCHAQGGNGQPALDTFSSAAESALAIAAALKNGTMPPFPPAAGCNTYVDELRLSASEQAIIEKWISSGTPAGDPARAPTYTPPTLLGTPDRELVPPEYTPKYPGSAGPNDLYWCFPLNPGVSVATDLIAAEIIPGQPNEVHHVIISRDPGGTGTSGRPATGFECDGVPGQMLYAWVPGARPFQLPPGVGMTLQPSDRLYMQVHYNRSPGVAPSPDQTVARLFFAKSTQPEHAYTVWTGTPFFSIPANKVGHPVNSTCTVTSDWKVLAIAPHMHTLGVQVKLDAQMAGASQCLMNIPRWDFNWQGGYNLQEPLVLKKGDKIKTQCVYNNNTNKTVSFGEATGEEMCFGFLTVVAAQRPVFGGFIPENCAQ